MDSFDLDSRIKQLNEIMSNISSSLGFSKIINNFIIQKEKEKLTIIPLGIGNGRFVKTSLKWLTVAMP